jgi:Domain of unknown function (DUF4258)
VRRRRYRLSLHAENERDADGIEIAELEEALTSERLELLEDYPTDPRGHSHLLLGFTVASAPIHVVCAIHARNLVIVTVYRPDSRLWHNHRVRRKGKA